MAPPNTSTQSASGRLTDPSGRRFEYLRLSLTDVCNFRCTYCLPNGYRKAAARAPDLSPDEIVRAVAAFARLGLWKIRLTGGEPTVRAEFSEIARRVAAVPGVRRVAMTTNGYRLADHAAGRHLRHYAATSRSQSGRSPRPACRRLLAGDVPHRLCPHLRVPRGWAVSRRAVRRFNSSRPRGAYAEMRRCPQSHPRPSCCVP